MAGCMHDQLIGSDTATRRKHRYRLERGEFVREDNTGIVSGLTAVGGGGERR